MLWIWAVLLLVVGMCMVVMDIFLPSGGILAFLSVCAVIAAVVLAFYQDASVGVAVLVAAVLGMPVVIVVSLWLLPGTSMGRRVLLQPPSSEEVTPDADRREALQSLVGRVGRAKSKMLPSGIVNIDNRTYDAVGEGMAIDEGQRVRVIEVRGARLIVEGIGDEDLASAAEQDPLARPVDWDSLDSLGNPPAA